MNKAEKQPLIAVSEEENNLTKTPETIDQTAELRSKITAAERAGSEEDILRYESELRLVEKKNKLSQVSASLEKLKQEAKILEKKQQDPDAVEAAIYQLEAEKASLEKELVASQVEIAVEDLTKEVEDNQKIEDTLALNIKEPRFFAASAAVNQERAGVVETAVQEIEANVKDYDIKDLDDKIKQYRTLIQAGSTKGATGEYDETQVLENEAKLRMAEMNKADRVRYEALLKKSSEKYQQYETDLYSLQQEIDKTDIQDQRYSKLTTEKSKLEAEFQTFVKTELEPLKRGENFELSKVKETSPTSRLQEATPPPPDKPQEDPNGVLAQAKARLAQERESIINTGKDLQGHEVKDKLVALNQLDKREANLNNRTDADYAGEQPIPENQSNPYGREKLARARAKIAQEREAIVNTGKDLQGHEVKDKLAALNQLDKREANLNNRTEMDYANDEPSLDSTIKAEAPVELSNHERLWQAKTRLIKEREAVINTGKDLQGHEVKDKLEVLNQLDKREANLIRQAKDNDIDYDTLDSDYTEGGAVSAGMVNMPSGSGRGERKKSAQPKKKNLIRRILRI